MTNHKRALILAAALTFIGPGLIIVALILATHRYTAKGTAP